MKHIQTSLLLTAALLLAAASAYTQGAKSSSAAGASASPSTPPTIASAIDREITIVEKELIDAAEAMPETPELACSWLDEKMSPPPSAGLYAVPLGRSLQDGRIA